MIVKKCYLLCNDEKREYYQNQMQNFYLVGVSFVNEMEQADLILIMENEVQSISSIKEKTNIPVFVISHNFSSKHLKQEIIDL